ncbi:MAG: FAD/NAD(P)-binding oxidoreductase [Tepidimonas sp.]|uniref:NAD(P)/FAD-dependent oxidoreductase n=1 Tax=Tepidimonas sp. TaxID=2002775 RepID=UPI00298F1F32|nr:FAD/NAD(P)-binding oxidoreductase [Tepidimonas sp.]MCS6811510.1 NAD(P)/FAD-dependent oxidoreductase [Tepidimonas sp.]MDW8336323.1 FAD/NAD(P)-binding oxidoreductase [Tepidimonas sp.]
MTDRPIDRRTVLQRLALATAGAAALGSASSPARAARAPDPVRTQARIAIVGAGAAGLASAARLSQRLEGAKITLIDARREHFYQPGYTLVGAGIKPASYVVSTTREYVPRGVEWIEEAAAEIDPEGRKVVTTSGRPVPFDFLIVACGLELNYGGIEGMEPALIGREGIGSVYYSPQAAAETWKTMAAFAQTGGVALLGRPHTDMKCAGAPLKYTFITDDRLRRAGTRGKTELHYLAPQKALFSVPIVAEKVRMLFQQRGVKTHLEHRLVAIDAGRRIATYESPAGRTEMKWDFIHVVPPMRAPEVVRNSPLPWQEGPFARESWLEVDRETLRHKRYANVFGVGDIAGVPKGKTAASVKWQVPVAVDHLVGDITGQPSQEKYNGYTSCPLITRLGRAMLIEFDYQDNLYESFPGFIAPLEELWVSWVMKTMALKPTYLSMLRGRA